MHSKFREPQETGFVEVPSKRFASELSVIAPPEVIVTPFVNVFAPVREIVLPVPFEICVVPVTETLSLTEPAAPDSKTRFW